MPASCILSTLYLVNRLAVTPGFSGACAQGVNPA